MNHNNIAVLVLREINHCSLRLQPNPSINPDRWRGQLGSMGLNRFFGLRKFGVYPKIGIGIANTLFAYEVNPQPAFTLFG